MKVELLKPHNHAGREYSAGEAIEMDKDAAEWLISIGSAKAAKAAKAAKPHEGNDK